ncbi:hypothetical protein B0H16DRAFT_1836836 [Mycena metata]|uniref:C2H2-type domain-containing protein n=1 Tax=Mycena metata TaxID=1033252 RepID=A0AAD7IZI1_9AGAR|nr:hypothetical protein B0H16DRAFT_1836836 [Mycena metata]
MSFPPAAFSLPLWDFMLSGDASCEDSPSMHPQQTGEWAWDPCATQSYDAPMMQLPYPFPHQMPPTNTAYFSHTSTASIACMSYAPVQTSSHMGRYQPQGAITTPILPAEDQVLETSYASSTTRIQWQAASNPALLAALPTDDPSLLTSLHEIQAAQRANGLDTYAIHREWLEYAASSTSEESSQSSRSPETPVENDFELQAPEFATGPPDALPSNSPASSFTVSSFTTNMGAPYTPMYEPCNFWPLPQAAAPAQGQNLYSPPLSAAGSLSPSLSEFSGSGSMYFVPPAASRETSFSPAPASASGSSTSSSGFSVPGLVYPSVPPSRETSFSPAPTSVPSTAHTVGPTRRPRTKARPVRFLLDGPGAPVPMGPPPAACARAGTLDDAGIEALIATATKAARAPVPIRCEWGACGAGITMNDLHTHLRDMHGVDFERGLLVPPTAQCEWGACIKTGEMRTDSLVKHILSGAHLARTIECPGCGQRYARTDVLRKHLKGGPWVDEDGREMKPRRRRGPAKGKKNANN